MSRFDKLRVSKKEYNPVTGSFPHRTLTYLLANGESKSEHIRRGIGLDQFYAGHEYPDRSSYYFSAWIIPYLLNRGLIERTRHGHYALTGKKWAK